MTLTLEVMVNNLCETTHKVDIPYSPYLSTCYCPSRFLGTKKPDKARFFFVNAALGLLASGTTEVLRLFNLRQRLPQLDRST